MRVVVAAAVVVSLFSGLAGSAWADAEARIAQLQHDLRSETPETVAHAAHAAGEEGLSALVPDLRQALSSRPKPEGRAAWLVVKHLLDALIRLDARVPMTVLQRYEDSLRTSVLILAAREGKAAHPLLRKTLAQSTSGERMDALGVAAGNLLCAAEDRSVAPFATAHVRTTLNITVIDHDRREFGGRRGSSDVHGDGTYTKLNGFPPSVWYELQFERDERLFSRQLAKGPTRDVWYERWVDTRKTFIRGFLSPWGDANGIARGWLASLLKLRVDELPLRHRYYLSHRWKDADTYTAAAAAKLSEIKRAAKRLLDRLVEADHLASTRRVSLVVEPGINVWDNRDDKREALPSLEE